MAKIGGLERSADPNRDRKGTAPHPERGPTRTRGAGWVIFLVPVVVTGAGAAPPPVPSTPAAVEELVYARPFTLKQGYAFEWCKERTPVREGYVLVLKVDPDLVYPRQSLEPVLYVGDHTAQRVNSGYQSGYVIAVVPAASGRLPETDRSAHAQLHSAPIWFGTPELPERVDTSIIRRERAKAEAAGVKPFARAVVAAALEKGGPRLEVKDRYELGSEMAALVRTYAPQEAHVADRLLVPRESREPFE